MFGVHPDKWQEKVLEVFPSQDKDKLRISLQAAVGPGKSALLSWVGWNFLTCYAENGQYPKGAAVSITSDNLSDNLWAEFSKWQSRSELLLAQFQWTKTRIFSKERPETWFMSARSFSKTSNEEEQGRTLSGLHSDYVLVLADESGDMPPSVLKAADQILSSCKWGKIIQAGNPTSHDGVLYQAATTQRHLWHIIKITGDPDDPDRSPRIDINWAKQQIATYGRDNHWVMSSILGQFPPTSINSLIGVDDVHTAMNRRVKHEDYAFAQKRLGVDVARFGTDRTCIFPRQGLVAFKPIVMMGARSNEIAARIMAAKYKWKSEVEFIDGSGGFGGGVVDSMIQAGETPQEISFSGKAIDPRYLNKRAEMYFLMAEWIKRGGSIPNMPELAKELVAPTYTFSNGKFQLESKDQIKKRTGSSPDLADALALTFALPEQAGYSPEEELLMSFNKPNNDWDPFR